MFLFVRFICMLLLNLDRVQLRCQLQPFYRSQALFIVIVIVIAAEIIIIILTTTDGRRTDGRDGRTEDDDDDGTDDGRTEDRTEDDDDDGTDDGRRRRATDDGRRRRTDGLHFSLILNILIDIGTKILKQKCFGSKTNVFNTHSNFPPAIEFQISCSIRISYSRGCRSFFLIFSYSYTLRACPPTRLHAPSPHAPCIHAPCLQAPC